MSQDKQENLALKNVRLKFTSKNFLEQYIGVINGFFQMTPQEMRVLVQLVRANPSMVTPETKKIVKDKLLLKNINIYIKALKDKGVLTGNRYVHMYHPIIVPDKEQKGLLLTWKIT